MAFSSDKALQTNQLPISIQFPRDPEEFLNVITDIYKRIANVVNSKEGALHLLEERANFQQYFRYSVPATFTPDPNNTRNGYRTDFDLVALNAGSIPPGATNLTLTTTSTPPLINGIRIPTSAYGAGTIAGPIYVFFNGTDVNVRFDNTNPAAQVIRITNNTGANLTQAYWTMNYLKDG